MEPQELTFDDNGVPDYENYNPSEYYEPGQKPFKRVELSGSTNQKKRRKTETYVAAVQLFETAIEKLKLSNSKGQLREFYDASLKQYISHYKEVLVAVVIRHLRGLGNRTSISAILTELELPQSLRTRVGPHLTRITEINSVVGSADPPERSLVSGSSSVGRNSSSFDPFFNQRLEIPGVELQELRKVYSDLLVYFSEGLASAGTSLPPFYVAVAVVAWDCFKGFRTVHGNIKKVKKQFTRYFVEEMLNLKGHVNMQKVSSWYSEFQSLFVKGMKVSGCVYEADYPHACLDYENVIKRGRLDPGEERWRKLCQPCLSARTSGVNPPPCLSKPCSNRGYAPEPPKRNLPTYAFSDELCEHDLTEKEWREIKMPITEAYVRYRLIDDEESEEEK